MHASHHTHTGTCHLTMVSERSVGLCEVWLGSMMGLDITGFICLRWFGGLGAICYVEVSSKGHKREVRAWSTFKNHQIFTTQHKTLGTFHIAQIMICSFHVQQKIFLVMLTVLWNGFLNFIISQVNPMHRGGMNIYKTSSVLVLYPLSQVKRYIFIPYLPLNDT